MPPAQKQALKTCALVATSAGVTALVWYAWQAWLPPWLYWGLWSFYLAGGTAWCCWMAWDTRRIERDRQRAESLYHAQVLELLRAGVSDARLITAAMLSYRYQEPPRAVQ